MILGSLSKTKWEVGNFPKHRGCPPNLFFSESVPHESWCNILVSNYPFFSIVKVPCHMNCYLVFISISKYFFFAEEPLKQKKNCPNPIKWGGLTGKRNKVALKKGGSAKIAVHPRGQPIYGHLQQTLYFCVFFVVLQKLLCILEVKRYMASYNKH